MACTTSTIRPGTQPGDVFTLRGTRGHPPARHRPWGPHRPRDRADADAAVPASRRRCCASSRRCVARSGRTAGSRRPTRVCSASCVTPGRGFDPTGPVPVTPRLFLVPRGSLGSGEPRDIVVVAGSEGRHAASVVRLSAGERVLVGDGAGRRALAEVVASDRHTLTTRVLDLQTEPAPATRFVLVQALVKGGRDEAAIEAATELGVDQVVPWQATRSVVASAGRAGPPGPGPLAGRRRCREQAVTTLLPAGGERVGRAG